MLREELERDQGLVKVGHAALYRTILPNAGAGDLMAMPFNSNQIETLRGQLRDVSAPC